MTVTAALKRTFTPIMGTALLIGIAAYVMELNRSQDHTSAGV
jgi:hypothetical protein